MVKRIYIFLYIQVCLTFGFILVGDAQYTPVGTGVAGPNEIWWVNGGNAMGQGVTACYEAVKLDQRCAKDYFTYSTRGDKNCGCKGSIDVLSIRQASVADYFKINAEGMHKFINTL